MNKQGIVKSISTLFPTEWHIATKFGVNQILISIAMASFCGINRICKIASFTGDGLVRALLKLDKAINENRACELTETANGIVDFLKEVEASLPENITKVIFRWDYLVKVKLKNLEDLLKAQEWKDVKGANDVAICEFSYRAKSWQRSRVLKAMRSFTQKRKIKRRFMPERQRIQNI